MSKRTRNGLGVVALLFVCAISHGQAPQTGDGGDSSAQEKQQAPAPRGTVVFERHAPPVEDTPPQTADPATPALPTPLPTRSGPKKQGLQRRAGAAGAPAAATPTEETGDAAAPMGAGAQGVPEAVLDRQRLARESEADVKAAGAIPAADRSALRIDSTDLDFHLNTHTGEATVRARLTVRNSGTSTMARIPLQISSALQWESARLLGGPAGPPAALVLEQHLLPTDLDHTGVAREVTLPLPQPLAPGGTASLELFYGGTLAANAERLLRLGAPAEQARNADWDTVSDEFTGLRGVGNVLWYPVAAAPAFLGEGVAFTQRVEDLRAWGATGRIRLRLTLEYAGSAPDAAFFLGERQPLLPVGQATPISTSSSSSSSADTTGEEHVGGIATAEWPMRPVGFHTPSLFVASAAPVETGEPEMRPVTDKPDAAAAYAAAAAAVRPLLADWLGASPSDALTVLDLPQAGAAPFADGRLLVVPMRAAEPARLAPALAYSLTAAWLPASEASPWLREGLAEFMRLLMLERTGGRDAALASLAADGDFLARREAFASPESVPLQICSDAVCARTKAAYVFEMLRTVAGENALKQAISGWRVAAARDPAKASAATLEALLTKTSGKDLQWFFGDWVEADRGLPDLTIVTVAPRRVERGAANNIVPAKRQIVGGPIGPEPVPQPGDPDSRKAAATAPVNGIAPAEGSWLVAVEVQNNGGAAAEVPVTVRSGSLINALPLRIPAHGRATIRVPFEAEPQEVVVNDGTVPEMRTSVHRRQLDRLP